MKKLIFLSLMLWGVAYGQSTLYLRADSVMIMKQGDNSELIILNGTRSVTNGLLQNIGNGRTRFVSLDSITTAPLANNGATLSGDTVQLGGTLTKATTIEGLNFPVEWTFNTLGASTGYKISSTSTVNPTTLQRLMEVNLSGSISGTSKTTTGLYVSNTHNYSGMGYSTSIGAHVVVSDTTDTNSLPLGIKINSYTNNSIFGDHGGILIEHYNDYSSNVSRSFGIKSVIRGGASIAGISADSTAAIVAINAGANNDIGNTNKSIGVFGKASGNFTGHNVGGYFDAQNGRRNFALVTRAASSFITAGDSTWAIVGIGAADSARASLIIEEASQDFEDFRDGAIWHFNDSLYGRFGGITYNLLSGTGSVGSQDLQGVLDTDTWLDKANTINQDGFLIQWNGPNQFNDTSATQISQRSFNSGVDYLIYTPIAQDTVVNLQLNVVDGFRVDVDNGTVVSYFQVKADGTYGESKLYELTTANTNSSGKLVLAPAGTNPTYYMYAETHASTPTTVGMIGVENSNIFYSVFDGDSTLIEMRAPYVMRFKGPGYMFESMAPPTLDTTGLFPIAMDATGLIKKVAWTYVEPVQTTGFAYSTEFLNNSLSANVNDAVLVPTLSGAGAFVGAGTGTTNHPGIIQIQAGTTTTGRLALAAAPTGLEFGAGTFSLETMVRIDDLSDGTETFGFLAGFMDAATSLNQADGVYFLYDSAGTSSGSFSSDKWQLVTVGGGTRTFVESSVVVAADTWYKLRIEVNVNASLVEYFINDVSMGTINTNIPTGSGEVTGFGAGIFKSAGTTNRIVELDYYKVNSTFDVVR